MRMIIRKLNNVDEKMDVMLRKINRLANKSQVSVHATAADEVDAPCLPPGICLPADWTTGCGDMAIWNFSKMAAAAMLDFSNRK